MTGAAYIASFLESKKIDTVFELQGGMITRIVDELSKNKTIRVVSMHHEQAAAFAADAYARVTGKPGVALATSGPGATNLLTGIGNCFFDSVPAIFITGQVNLNEQKGEQNIRQKGFQETDIVSMALPITKAAYAVKSVNELPQILEDAYCIAMTGRQGPVLIDIPMNIQREEVGNTSVIEKGSETTFDVDKAALFCEQLIKALTNAKRPLILVGRGVRAGNAVIQTRELAEKLNIPVVSSLLGVDVLPYQHPLRIGMIGSYGNRWANYAVGNSDVLLVLGSRLDLRQTGADVASFQENKTIFHVDIDVNELNNRFKNCITLQADLIDFLKIIFIQSLPNLDTNEWQKEIQEKRELRTDTQELSKIQGINPNAFMHLLSKSAIDAGVYITDVGNNQMWAAQSVEINENQQFLSSGGMGSMGYALPAGIGASFALDNKPVVVIAGDGGFQINIQELQTIRRNNLPVKIILLNNKCLGMIRQFQDSYFESCYYSTVWGYDAPNFARVANAYDIESFTISKVEDIEIGLSKLWKDPEQPFLLDVVIDLHTNVFPKMLFGNPITKMEPLN